MIIEDTRSRENIQVPRIRSLSSFEVMYPTHFFRRPLDDVYWYVHAHEQEKRRSLEQLLKGGEGGLLDEAKLRGIASTGVPDAGGLRPVLWRFLLRCVVSCDRLIMHWRIRK